MARVDDYIHAKTIAIEKLQKTEFADIIRRSGYDAIEGNIFRVPFLDRVYRIEYPDFAFSDESGDGKEIPLQEQVLILHYLIGADSDPVDDNWITYREIPGASFYFSVFVKRAVDPLKSVFGQDPDGFSRAAHGLGGKTIEHGDAAFEFAILPKVSVQIILWEGDDEFPPEANILFDETVSDILTPEDIAWLSGLLVYRLISISKQTGHSP
jgi:hypothetical protein